MRCPPTGLTRVKRGRFLARNEVQRLSAPSTEHDANHLPSGDHAIAETSSACPSSRPIGSLYNDDWSVVLIPPNSLTRGCSHYHACLCDARAGGQ